MITLRAQHTGNLALRSSADGAGFVIRGAEKMTPPEEVEKTLD